MSSDLFKNMFPTNILLTNPKYMHVCVRVCSGWVLGGEGVYIYIYIYIGFGIKISTRIDLP